MAITEGVRLAQSVREKAQEVKGLCQAVDEQEAGRSPRPERWTVKQVVSHLCGPDGKGFLPSLLVFLEQDSPRIDIDPENPFFTPRRASLTLTQLLAEFDGEYSRIAEFVSGLTDDQLARKAHIPLLVDTPIGQFPTLAQWVTAIAAFHLNFHVDHLRQILQELGHGGSTASSA